VEIRQKRSLHKDWIDRYAYQIVEDLQKAGHTSYLVGGCVRDLLAGLPPKDFDIVTDATPQEVKRRIRNAYIIGKRFRLVLVHRFQKKYEVATFRREASAEDIADIDENISKDNFFGKPEEDANRRDFTVNGIFYDCVNNEVIDFVNGIRDLEDGYLKMIGDPWVRLEEDPIRILRAIRLSQKLRLKIEPSLRQAIEDKAECLKNSALPRRREDFLKILRLDNPALALLEAYDLGVLKSIFPTLHEMFSNAKATEIFLYYFSFKREVLDENEEPDTTEEYAFFLYCFFKAMQVERPMEWYLNEESMYKDFLRNEISLFKAESDSIRKLFQMIDRLQTIEPDKVKRKSKSHYQQLRNLPTALHYCKMDYLLSPEKIHFWLKG
jgi:poly(A) polymerase